MSTPIDPLSALKQLQTQLSQLQAQMDAVKIQFDLNMASFSTEITSSINYVPPPPLPTILNIKQVLQKNGWRLDGKLLAHWMNWFGDSHYHPMNRYISTNPATISKQLDVAQLAGVDGFIVTYQGINVKFGHQATMELLRQLESRNMLFCLLVDPWMMGDKPNGEQLVLQSLSSPDCLGMLNSPAYLPEKYVLDFVPGMWNTSIVTTALQKIVPAFNVLSLHKGFAWMSHGPLGTPQDVISNIKTQHSNPLMKIPALFHKFWDGGNPNTSAQFVNPVNQPGYRLDGNGIDYNTQSWGSNLSRCLEDGAGNTFWDVLATLPMQSKYMALLTWNDYNERTAWEALFSILCNERIN